MEMGGYTFLPGTYNTPDYQRFVEAVLPALGVAIGGNAADIQRLLGENIQALMGTEWLTGGPDGRGIFGQQGSTDPAWQWTNDLKTMGQLLDSQGGVEQQILKHARQLQDYYNQPLGQIEAGIRSQALVGGGDVAPSSPTVDQQVAGQLAQIRAANAQASANPLLQAYQAYTAQYNQTVPLQKQIEAQTRMQGMLGALGMLWGGVNNAMQTASQYGQGQWARMTTAPPNIMGMSAGGSIPFGKNADWQEETSQKSQPFSPTGWDTNLSNQVNEAARNKVVRDNGIGSPRTGPTGGPGR